MSLPEVHLIGGTRPEAVKLAPVAIAMRAAGLLTPVLVAGGQHPAMIAQSLAAFDLAPDVTLTPEPGTGSQSELLTEMIKQFDALWAERTPAAVIVQGDTTTSLAGALAACWHRIPVVHLEAGLRSGELDASFPEEANRRLVAQVATLHLTLTPLAAMNLLDENIATGDVLITGTTVVDATLAVVGRKLPYSDAAVAAARFGSENRLVLVTAHRRESWGAPLDRVLAAVKILVRKYADIDVILPSRPDPAVRAQVEAALGGIERVTITDPLPYADLCRLLSEAYLVLTDSGGIQEEAPSFRVPALVLREVTEHVESLHAGCGKLVGTDTAVLVREASALLDSGFRRDAMTAGGNPYGDGLAAGRTAQATAALLGLAEQPAPMPSTRPPTVNHSAPATFGAST
jgi:UDP-N-acetylglucosamine 2-epimerase (non-hydrolysing)